MRKMPLTDALFLIMESRRIPMHVGGLNVFTLPKDVDDTTFLSNLGEVLKYDGELRRPFGEKLKMGPLGVAGSISWEKDQELDMDYHIRHSALPKPGRYRELFSLVSRLHGTLLDRSRPLWEIHLIEGLENRQFATYFKAHHCGIDGVGAMHLMSSMYSTNERTKVTESPFSKETFEAYKKQLQASLPAPADARDDEVLAVTDAFREQLGSVVNVGKALRDSAGIWMGKQSKMVIPFHNVPKSSLSAQLTGARRFVAQSWPFERVRGVAKAFDGTLNDAVLAMCAGALRRQLLEHNELPNQSLKCMAPVSIRAAGDLDSSNAVGMVCVDLATNMSDPVKRFGRIKESMDAAKGQLQGMSAKEIQIYTGISQAPVLLSQLLGAGSKVPAFSTIISNVPGPRERRYWNGARVDGMYPVSIPSDGSAVNFTVVSNFDNLDFGIVACRKSVPRVQRLIDFMEESLLELEEAAGLRTASGRLKAPKNAAVKAKAKTKAKAKAKAKTKPKPKPKPKPI